VTENRVQRRLAAIVMADVVSYSRMMGEDEAGTLAAVTRRIETIIRPVVSAHEGRIVKLMGDGVLIEFGSAVSAVKAAIEMQDKMQAANAGLPEDRRIVCASGSISARSSSRETTCSVPVSISQRAWKASPRPEGS
jgi:class 3 adenylate cyclase